MIRIKSSELAFIDNTAYHQGELFTGIAYFLSGAIIEKAIKYKNGEEIDIYICETLHSITPKISIDADFLESEDDQEPYLYENKLFSGMAYDFNDNKCVGEALYKNGNLFYEASWYDTGEIATLEIAEQQLYQNIWWNADGSYRHVEISEKNSFSFKAIFNDENLLTSISIDGDYFSRVPFLKEKIKIKFLETAFDIKKLRLAPYLYLSGSNIDSDFIESLKKSKGYGDIKKIHINCSKLPNDNIVLLANQNNLQEFLIDDENNKSLKIAQEIKNKHRNCHVEHNRAVLT